MRDTTKHFAKLDIEKAVEPILCLLPAKNEDSVVGEEPIDALLPSSNQDNNENEMNLNVNKEP